MLMLVQVCHLPIHTIQQEVHAATYPVMVVIMQHGEQPLPVWTVIRDRVDHLAVGLT